MIDNKYKIIIDENTSTLAKDIINNGTLESIKYYSTEEYFKGVIKDGNFGALNFTLRYWRYGEESADWSYSSDKTTMRQMELIIWSGDDSYSDDYQIVFDGWNYKTETKYSTDDGSAYKDVNSSHMTTEDIADVSKCFYIRFLDNMKKARLVEIDERIARNIKKRSTFIKRCQLENVLADVLQVIHECKTPDFDPESDEFDSDETFNQASNWGACLIMNRWNFDDEEIDYLNTLDNLNIQNVIDCWIKKGSSQGITVQYSSLLYFEIIPDCSYEYTKVADKIKDQGYGFEYTVKVNTSSYSPWHRTTFRNTHDRITKCANWSSLLKRIKKEVPEAMEHRYEAKTILKRRNAKEITYETTFSALEKRLEDVIGTELIDSEDFDNRVEYKAITHKGVTFNVMADDDEVLMVTIREHDVMVKDVPALLDALIDNEAKKDEARNKNASQIETLEGLKKSLEKQIEGLEEQMSVLNSEAMGEYCKAKRLCPEGEVWSK